MKHFGIKLLVVVGFVLYGLPRLYAQTDTVLTIYGTKFADGAKVYFNGVEITPVLRDSLQPSRILRIRVPFSLLQQAPALAGIKDGGAKIQSDEITHTIRVENPSPNRGGGVSTITVIPRRTRVRLFRNLTDSVASPFQMPDVALNQQNIITLYARYENVTGNLDIQKQAISMTGSHATDTQFFEILDSTGTVAYSPIPVQGSGNIRFRVLCIGSSVGQKKIFLSLGIAGQAATRRQYEAQCFGVYEFKILTAYTDSSGMKDFDMYGKINRQNPKNLIESSIDKINVLLQQAVVTGDTSKFANTRFVVATAPFKVAYKEQSPDPHLHADIDALEESRFPGNSIPIPEIRTALGTPSIADNLKCTILLVNTDGTPYRAIGTDLIVGKTIPRSLVVEIKYIDRFLDAGRDFVDSFLDLKAITLDAFFYDPNLLKSLRDAINNEF